MRPSVRRQRTGSHGPPSLAGLRYRSASPRRPATEQRSPAPLQTADTRVTAGSRGLSPEARFLLFFNIAFAAIAALLLAPVTVLRIAHTVGAGAGDGDGAGDGGWYQSGHAVCALVLGWNVAFAACTKPRGRARSGPGTSVKARGYPQLYGIWVFAATLSVLMVLPDWVLVAVVGSLEFPPDGAPMLTLAGDSTNPNPSAASLGVKVYMAGMWAIPLVAVLFACMPAVSPATSTGRPAALVLAGQSMKSAHPTSASALRAVDLFRAAVLSAVVFGLSEQLTAPLNLWRKTATVSATVGHVALYVLPAEAVLGPLALVACHWDMACTATLCTAPMAAAPLARGAGATAAAWRVAGRVAAAAVTALAYTGALLVGHLFVEPARTHAFAHVV